MIESGARHMCTNLGSNKGRNICPGMTSRVSRVLAVLIRGNDGGPLRKVCVPGAASPEVWGRRLSESNELYSHLGAEACAW